MKLAKITFGSPNKRCLGHGICEITPWERTPSAPNLGCAPVKSSWYRSSNGVLVLMVPSLELSNAVLDKHFSGQSFIMEESLLLPAFLQDYFGFTEAFLIPAGTYPIARKPNLLMVCFTF